MKTRVLAIRDNVTRERLTYRFRPRDAWELQAPLARLKAAGRDVSIYQTSMDLPPAGRRNGRRAR